MNVYACAFTRPDGATGIVGDDSNRLVLFGLRAVAVLFAAALQVRGASVHVIELTPGQVTDALLTAGIDADELDAHVSLVEAATVSPADAVRWTRELAERVPLQRR
jgi:hypothetical protein